MKHYFEITVHGKGRFPFDMLRHSRCWPVTTADAENLDTPDPESLYLDRRTVRLGMTGHYIEAANCVERFASFLWVGEVTKEERL